MPVDNLIDLGTFGSLFLLGLFSVGHCLSMCGGISSGLALQSERPRVTIFAINVGRVSSYALIGAFVSLLGSLDFINALGFQLYLLAFTDFWLLLLGLYLSSVSGFAIVKLEIIARPIWRLINPMLKKVLPIHNVWTAYAAGFLWGFIPCGLTYGVAITALSASNPIQGSLLMISFGIGTLPNMIILGFFMNQIRRIFTSLRFRRIAGSIIVLMALLRLYQDFT